MSWEEHFNPVLDDDIVPFWDGLKRHEFLLFTCKRCGAAYWPYAYCRRHADIPRLQEMEWRKASGRGKIYGLVVVHQARDPNIADEVPYPLALIELEEGPIFGSRIVGYQGDPHEIGIGTPVEVIFQDVPQTGWTLPLFRPTSHANR